MLGGVGQAVCYVYFETQVRKDDEFVKEHLPIGR